VSVCDVTLSLQRNLYKFVDSETQNVCIHAAFISSEVTNEKLFGAWSWCTGEGVLTYTCNT